MRKYFGQFDPPLDQVLYERFILNKIAVSGVGIECGAADGESESTLKFFEDCLGWRIVNIECSPPLYERLIVNRPKALNIQAALYSESSKVNFTHAIHPIHGANFGNGSINHDLIHKQSLIEAGCIFQTYEVESVTYEQIIERARLQAVDILVLDVEGAELDAIIGMTNSTTLPKLICVENTISDTARLDTALASLGYSFAEQIYNNAVYIHKSTMPVSKVYTREKDIPTVNIVTNIRETDKHLKAFFRQIESLFQSRCTINRVIATVDGNVTAVVNTVKELTKVPFIAIPEGESEQETKTLLDRATQWASVGNENLRASSALGADYTLIIESDLCFPADLADRLIRTTDAITAPIVYLGSKFYDSWGFRTLNGKRLNTTTELNSLIDSNGLAQLGSVGSCLLVPQKIINAGIRMPPRYEDGLLVGFCNAARANDYSVVCDTQVAILHPVDLWSSQLWHVSRIYLNDLIEPGTRTLDATTANLRLAGRYPEFSNDLIKAYLNSAEPDLANTLRKTGVQIYLRTVATRNDRSIAVIVTTNLNYLPDQVQPQNISPPVPLQW